MGLNEQYLELYKQLEDLLDKRYPKKGTNSSVWLYEKENEGEPAKRLAIIRETRNFIAHTPKFEQASPVVVNQEIVEYLQMLIQELECPKTAFSISTKRENLIMGSLETKVIDALSAMKEKGFTHFPILDRRDYLLGVFSEGTISSYLADSCSLLIDEKMQLSFFKDYLEIGNHRSESFDFISKNTSVNDAKALFDRNMTEKKKLAVLFITEAGKPDQKILGIVTPWDFLKK